MSLPSAIRRQLEPLRDPVHRPRVMAALAATERIGAADLDALAQHLPDPQQGQQIASHADDLRRHADQLLAAGEPQAQPFDWLAGKDTYGLDLRGVPTAGALASLGIPGALATWAVACELGAEVFDHCHSLTNAPEFAALSANAKRHRAELTSALQALTDAGHGTAIAQARRARQRSGALAQWKRLGIRSGAGFSRFVLYVAYWTVLLPFGLLTRSPKPSPQAAAKADSAPIDRLRAQY